MEFMKEFPLSNGSNGEIDEPQPRLLSLSALNRRGLYAQAQFGIAAVQRTHLRVPRPLITANCCDTGGSIKRKRKGEREHLQRERKSDSTMEPRRVVPTTEEKRERMGLHKSET